ncbi:hypothetical protein GQX74_010723 [Glossina fuscipes]|nr:hypothetical protein GQX74_010723 [Glossina fuscipes]
MVAFARRPAFLEIFKRWIPLQNTNSSRKLKLTRWYEQQFAMRVAVEINPAQRSNNRFSTRNAELLSKLEGNGDDINATILLPSENGVINVSYENLGEKYHLTSGISDNWDEDDNDIFASISMKEILGQNEKINNSPNIPKFQVNKQIVQGFRTANGKKVVITKEGKKRVEALQNEFHESDGDENNLLCFKNTFISKKQSMLSGKKAFNISLVNRKEEGEGDYPR